LKEEIEVGRLVLDPGSQEHLGKMAKRYNEVEPRQLYCSNKDEGPMRFVWCSVKMGVDEVEHGSMSLFQRAYFVGNEVYQDPWRCAMNNLIWKRLEAADTVQPRHPLVILSHGYFVSI